MHVSAHQDSLCSQGVSRMKSLTDEEKEKIAAMSKPQASMRGGTKS